MALNVIKQLTDQNEAPISNMDASWTSRWYSMGENLHLCIHLLWDDNSPEGDLYLDYSGDPIDDGSQVTVGFSVKNQVVLDGTFQDEMFLDANLAVASFRLRFEHTAGAANLNTFIVRKRS